MAMPPILLYAIRIDPAGALAALREAAAAAGAEASVEVVLPRGGGDWSEAAATLPGPDGPLRLVLRNQPDYYAGPDWPRQRLGMQGYFLQFPECERKAEVLRLIGALRFCLATRWEPEADRLEDDPRTPLLLAVAQRLEAVLFRPSELRDGAGRTLIDGEGAADPEAVLPPTPPDSNSASATASTPAEAAAADEDAGPSEGEEEVFEDQPPTPQQAARRALALAVLTARALLEQDDPSEPWTAEFHQDALAWAAAVGLGDELEPDELRVLQTPPGKLDPQACLDATWRLEGLAVLAWSLGLFELPPYDETVPAQELVKALGFPYVEPALALLAAPSLRPAAELHAFRKRILAVHWRLREFRLRPAPLDFRKTVAESFSRFDPEWWFGPTELESLRLIDGDLAVGGRPLVETPAEHLAAALSIALERHRAVNWLTAGGVYSETDTST